MANPLWAALGGLGGGLTQLAQTLANRRMVDEERRRQFEVQNQQMALQREQFEHLKSQNALQNTRQGVLDQRAIDQQEFDNLLTKLNFAGPRQRLDPGIATAAHRKQIPLIHEIDPTPQTNQPIAPGMPAMPGVGLPSMGYSRAPTMAERASEQNIETSRAQLAHTTASEGREATKFADLQSVIAEIAGLKPGQVPSQKALAVLNRNAEDFWNPEQKIAFDAKRSGAMAQAQANVQRKMTEGQRAQQEQSMRRQVQTLANPLYILEERFKGMEDAYGRIINAAKTRGNGPEAQTILVNFQKQLDALSVVREAEYLRSEQIRPLEDRIRGIMTKIRTGSALGPDEFKGYVDMSRILRDNAREIFEQRISPYKLSAADKGIDWAMIFNPPWKGSAQGGEQQPDFIAIGQPNMSVLPKNYSPGGKR